MEWNSFFDEYSKMRKKCEQNERFFGSGVEFNQINVTNLVKKEF